MTELGSMARFISRRERVSASRVDEWICDGIIIRHRVVMVKMEE